MGLAIVHSWYLRQSESKELDGCGGQSRELAELLLMHSYLSAVCRTRGRQDWREGEMQRLTVSWSSGLRPVPQRPYSCPVSPVIKMLISLCLTRTCSSHHCSIFSSLLLFWADKGSCWYHSEVAPDCSGVAIWQVSSERWWGRSEVELGWYK